jgi:L,D-peptidoglycan transpeptidase YkuD (ErfK/YbiS/YcfS/YnhG family)
MHIGRKNKWLAGIAISFILLAGISIWIYTRPEPPIRELNKARLALSSAQKNSSGTYSAKLYKESQSNYNMAMTLWERENRKYFFQRDYTQISHLAKKATEKANLAKDRSMKNMADFKSRLSKKIKETEEILKLFDSNFDNLPLPVLIKKKEVKARMMFTEGKLAFEKKNYLTSATKIDKASDDIQTVYLSSKKKMQDYFQNHRKWVQLAEETIDESKRNGSAILVDKMAGKCYLYNNGELRFSWSAELGKNWVGNKLVKGDKATPEGTYRITGKKAGRGTTYYKALMINYPNDEDKRRFSLAKKNGELSRSSSIGNNIEIHGGGGKGVHWTDGCVALQDRDMDKIFREVNVGTRVTIVGSLRPFNEVFKLQ